MNKTELIDAIAQEAGMAKVDAKRALDALLKVTSEALSNGDSVTIVGFGAFKVCDRKERTGMNPRTHQKIQIPASRVVRFKPGAELERAVEEGK